MSVSKFVEEVDGTWDIVLVDWMFGEIPRESQAWSQGSRAQRDASGAAIGASEFRASEFLRASR